VPLVFVAGLVYHRETLSAAAAMLGPPDRALLVRAGHLGLTDPTMGALAPALCDLALDGCRALGTTFVDAEDIDTANRYFDRYTRRALAPADD
jgi:hypothetical protein